MDPDPTADDTPSSPPPERQPHAPPKTTITTTTNDRDFLLRLESYLAKRDGVDKLLKISRYASKLILASSLLPSSSTSTRRLKTFESNVGISRKAFRLGKFIQDVNALRSLARDHKRHDLHRLILSIIAYGGEGAYFFVEQFIWLAKSGLIDSAHARMLQKVSAWAEMVGYVGSVGLKIRELREMNRELESTAEIEKVKLKMMMKKMSVLQDLADAVMALSDITDGKGGLLSAPLMLSGAGLLSALISTHKNWTSC